MRLFLTTMLMLTFGSLLAQNSMMKGRITHQQHPLSDVRITLQNENGKFNAVSSQNGTYQLSLPSGQYKIMVSLLGMQTINDKITIAENQSVTKDFDLKEDLLGLEEVVITGTRSDLPQFLTPVVVSKISGKVFETTQSLSLAEGLKFTPGLRTETNCQNCGFNQVRINGLDGSYSQILINGRPVFSALAGVYGLEMIPANMIRQVEVVRGGGSVLYGGNAIAGTINIITRDPYQNTFSIGENLSLYEGKTPDNTLFANAAIVSEGLDKGITLFAYNRNRKPYDANGDEYSEITALKNTTFGADMFWNTSDRSRLKASFNTISEFRRGGNKFDLLPHESDVTEQLRHQIVGGDVSFEHFSSDFAHKFAYYLSLQHTGRDSYYGTGLGFRVGQDEFEKLDDSDPTKTDEKDEFFNALASYGTSKGLVGVGGIQYNYVIDNQWNLSLGTELTHDSIEDIARQRIIKQRVKTLGSYLQLEWKPIENLTLLAGSRYDHTSIKGKYEYSDEMQGVKKSISKFVPRFTAMYDVDENFKLRATYSQGYRAPQAFDEALHLEVLGGEVVFIELDRNLKTETSDSFTTSLNYSQKEGENQANIIVEGFYNRIKNKFHDELLSEEEVIRKIRTNAKSHLDVYGVNAEFSFAFGKEWLWQTGITFQKSLFSEPEELWTNEKDPADTRVVAERKVLRTPDLYGFTNLTYSPTEDWKFSYSGVYTGSMIAPRIEGDEEFVNLIKTPSFFEQNLRVAYNLKFKDNYNLEFSTGIQNIFNSYQKDFGIGKDRDPNYIYGPQRPRTFFFGVTYKFN